MLDSAIKFEKAFERFGDCDLYFIKDLTDERKPGVPTAFDWNNARRMVQVLEHFYELTIWISGSLYVTSCHTPNSGCDRSEANIHLCLRSLDLLVTY